MQHPNVAILLLALFTSAAAGQDAGDTLLNPTRGRMDLTLEETLEMARRDNLGLKVSALDGPIAAASIQQARGLFWPSFYLNADYTDRETAPRSLFQPEIKNHTYGLRSGFLWRALYTGATMDLSYDHRYSHSEADYPALGASDDQTNWAASMALSISQPLLKGAWKEYNRADIRSAELGAEAARQSHENAVQQTLLQVTQAYWNLVYARENCRVRRVSLEVARKQLEITEQRIQNSLEAPVARVANQADIARREQDLIGAENLVLQAEDGLKALIFPFQDNRQWAVRLVPTSHSDKGLDFTIPPSEDASLAAMDRRRDLKAARLEVERRLVALTKTESHLLPELNLVGSYASEDVGVHTDMLFQNITNSRYPGWTIGLEFSYPLWNVSAKGERRAALYSLEQARRNQRLLEVTIWKEVRDAVRDLNSLRKEIEAGRVSVRLATTNLQTEEEKFKVGKSIAFEVQRRNEDLADAKARLIRTVVDFQIAVAALRRAMGDLE